MAEHDILHGFLNEQNGKIICISGDLSLARALRHALAAHSKSLEDIIFPYHNPEDGVDAIDVLYKQNTPLIVCVERTIDGEKTTNVIYRIKRFYPAVHLLVVGSNITRELAGYLFEIGVSSIISKPISADEILKKIIASIQPSKEQLLTAYVRDLIASSSNEEAIGAIESFIKINHDSSLAYSLKGDVLFTSGNLEEAITAYEHAIQINPSFTEPLKRMAAIYKYVDDKKALNLLSKSDSIIPFNPDRKMEMAELHLRLGEKDKAKAKIETGFKQASQEFSVLLGDYTERISELVSDKMPELAEEYLAKAIMAKKTFTVLDLHMFNKLGMIYRNKGDWKKAIEVYKKALDIAPKDPALFYNTALAYHDGEKPEEVLRCLDKAFSLSKDFYKNNEGVSYNLGSIYLEYDDKVAAKPFLENALKLNPINERARKKLERC